MALLDKIFGRKPKRVPSASGTAGYSSVYSYYSQYMALQQDRIAKLRDYREMGDYSDISAFLDAVAEEAVQYDRIHNAPLWIESDSDVIKKQFEILVKRLDLENRLMGIAFQLAKFGEVFYYNAVFQSDHPAVDENDDTSGIGWILYDEPENVEPILDERRLAVGYRSQDIVPQNPASKGILKLWEFTHFKIMSSSLMIDAGDSLLAPVRRTWRMLKMMEDAAVIYRLVKGPDRFVYYIDVGQSTPQEGQKIVQSWQDSIRKRSYINPQTGQFDERWLGITVEEDIYWPIRRGTESRVERLTGAGNLPHIDDIVYFRDKLYAGLKAPKAFFNQEDATIRGRALAMQDVWFARTVKRVQNALIRGLGRMFDVHLAAQNIDPRLPDNKYNICFHNPSNIEELQELEATVSKFEAANVLFDFGVKARVDSVAWVKALARDVLDLPETLVEIIDATSQPALDPFDMAAIDQVQQQTMMQQQAMAGPQAKPAAAKSASGKKPAPAPKKKPTPKKEDLIRAGLLTDGISSNSYSPNMSLPDSDWTRDDISMLQETAPDREFKPVSEVRGGDKNFCCICSKPSIGIIPIYDDINDKLTVYPLCKKHKETDGFDSEGRPILA